MATTAQDLGYNALRKTPCLPLRKLTRATTIILDGNHFTALESGALHDVRVKFLSISRNANLARIDENAIRAMPDLQVRTPRERERERERDSFPSRVAIANVSQFAFHPP